MNGKLVKPTIVEQNIVKFNQLSKGYYFLVGRIGEIEIKEKWLLVNPPPGLLEL